MYRACATINMKAPYPDHHVGIIDAGVSLTWIYFNSRDATLGSAVSSEFCTD